MTKWQCPVCGYIYTNQEAPNSRTYNLAMRAFLYGYVQQEEYETEIPFESLPDSYKCPVCQTPKRRFVMIER